MTKALAEEAKHEGEEQAEKWPESEKTLTGTELQWLFNVEC